MKKRMILMALTVLFALSAMSQIVYGDKSGWSVYTTEDEYSGKKSHYMRYYDQQHRLAASFFPGPNRLAVLEWYDGVLFMDETLEAVTDRHGKFPDRQVDYEWRVALPKDDSSEDFGTVKMTFGDVDRVGDTFFGTFVFDVDCDELMAGKSIAVRWHDPMRDEQLVRKISLQGFTRCYDEVLRRYGVKRKK